VENLKCGAGGWRRSVGPIVRKMKKYYIVKEERSSLHAIKKSNANWIGNILRRNCLLKHVTEGKMEGWIGVSGRRGRRSKQLLDDLKEETGHGKLIEEALDRALWRARFGRRYGHVVRQTKE
jgi:hypothetical protein